jgi:hypothetical protein
MNTKWRRFTIAVLVVIAFVFTESGAFVYAGSAAKVSETQGKDIVVTSWIAQSQPKENVSHLKDFSSIKVGVTKSGKNNVGLVRFALPSGITPSEVVSARLSLKKKSGDAPRVRVGIVKKDWAYSVVSWNDLKGKIKYGKKPPLLKAQGGGWYSADVTKFVKSWLSSKTNNCGFALKETRKGKSAKFVSAYAKSKKNYPLLKITYRNKKLKKSFGKYGYTKQPASKGNCFSYAMRDTDEIFLNDILTSKQKREFQNISNKSAGAALNYFKRRAVDYINAHRKKLGIKSCRVLSSPGKKYDPKKEYLVAMKLGFVSKGYGSGPGGSYLIPNDFDYHWRVKLNDGRWAEKITNLKTRIVPGSNPSYNVGKYPWDGSYMWGYARYNRFYNTKTVYIAVTKNTNKFTAHKH